MDGGCDGMKGREMDVRRGIVTEEKREAGLGQAWVFFGFGRHKVLGTWRYRVTLGGERGERALLFIIGGWRVLSGPRGLGRIIECRNNKQSRRNKIKRKNIKRRGYLGLPNYSMRHLFLGRVLAAEQTCKHAPNLVTAKWALLQLLFL